MIGALALPSVVDLPVRETARRKNGCPVKYRPLFRARQDLEL